MNYLRTHPKSTTRHLHSQSTFAVLRTMRIPTVCTSRPTMPFTKKKGAAIMHCHGLRAAPNRLYLFHLASEFRALWTLSHIYALAVRLRSLALPLKLASRAQARVDLQKYLFESGAHHFFVSGAEEPELIDDVDMDSE
jgi:hypothetical protein